MNYLQLQVGGKTLDLYFNMAAYRSIKESTGDDPLSMSVDVSDLDGLDKFGLAFFQAGLKGAAADKGITLDFTAADVLILFEKLNISQIVQVMAAFKKSCELEPVGAVGEAAAKDTQE